MRGEHGAGVGTWTGRVGPWSGGWGCGVGWGVDRGVGVWSRGAGLGTGPGTEATRLLALWDVLSQGFLGMEPVSDAVLGAGVLVGPPLQEQ